MKQEKGAFAPAIGKGIFGRACNGRGFKSDSQVSMQSSQADFE